MVLSDISIVLGVGWVYVAAREEVLFCAYHLDYEMEKRFQIVHQVDLHDNILIYLAFLT